MKKFKVYAIEQNDKRVWSEHSTEKAAIAAARKYRRMNPDRQGWVDSCGYMIVGPETEIEFGPQTGWKI